MIITRQMQNAMHHQMGGVVGKRLPGGLGFFFGHAVGDSDVAAIVALTGEGQDIGRLVLATEVTIERPQLLVVRQQGKLFRL